MKYNTALPYIPVEDVKSIISEVEDIIAGNALLTRGPRVREFEELFSAYVGTKYGVALNSGTSALEVALKAIGIKHGDEVIVPVQTFVSTGSCVMNNGGTPVFCGIDENHLMSFKDLKNRITDRTKAVIIVHFCGMIHPEILEMKHYLADRNIVLIEDAAHAHGAKIDDLYAGNIGDLGCFSFFATKIMTTGGEGGMIATNDESLYHLCASLGAIGIDKQAPVEIYPNAGSNNRMTEIQALVGITQLRRLDSFVSHRNEIVNMYKDLLTPLSSRSIINFQNVPPHILHPYWRFMVSINIESISRATIREKLRVNGINIDWPYSPLLHLQPVFSDFEKGSYVDSEDLASRHFCLPVHLNIQSEDVMFISEKLIACFTGNDQ